MIVFMIIGHVAVQGVARVKRLDACAAAVARVGGEMFGFQVALASKSVPEGTVAEQAAVAAPGRQLGQVLVSQLFQLA